MQIAVGSDGTDAGCCGCLSIFDRPPRLRKYLLMYKTVDISPSEAVDGPAVVVHLQEHSNRTNSGLC